MAAKIRHNNKFMEDSLSRLSNNVSAIMVMRQFAGGKNNLKHMWRLFFPCVKNEATIPLIECDLHP